MTATISRRTLLTATGSAALIGTTAGTTRTPESPRAQPHCSRASWKPNQPRPCPRRPLGPGHLAQPGRDDRRDDRPARRQHRRLGHEPGPQQLHLADQHRRLPVEHGRRPPPRHHLAAGVAAPDHPDADHDVAGRPPRARAACTSTGTTRRPARCATSTRTGRGRSRRSCRASTTAGSPAALMVVRNAEPRARGPRGFPAGQDELRLLLQPRRPARRTDARRLLRDSAAGRGDRQGQPRRHRAGRVLPQVPLRHLQHRGPDRGVHRHLALGQVPHDAVLRHLPDLPGHAATGPGWSRSRRACTGPTSVSTSSRARTRTAGCGSCRRGAATCSSR